MKLNEISGEVLDSSLKVHKALGPGLLESTYEECLAFELVKRGLAIKRQQPIPLVYDKIKLECGYRCDLIVENQVIVEVKSIEAFDSIHVAQILTYMKLNNCELGLLINFNVELLKNGFRRVILNKQKASHEADKL